MLFRKLMAVPAHRRLVAVAYGELRRISIGAPSPAPAAVPTPAPALAPAAANRAKDPLSLPSSSSSSKKEAQLMDGIAGGRGEAKRRAVKEGRHGSGSSASGTGAVRGTGLSAAAPVVVAKPAGSQGGSRLLPLTVEEFVWDRSGPAPKAHLGHLVELFRFLGVAK